MLIITEIHQKSMFHIIATPAMIFNVVRFPVPIVRVIISFFFIYWVLPTSDCGNSTFVYRLKSFDVHDTLYLRCRLAIAEIMIRMRCKNYNVTNNDTSNNINYVSLKTRFLGLDRGLWQWCATWGSRNCIRGVAHNFTQNEKLYTMYIIL